MPRKIRELIRELKEAGFEFEPGKGSHKKFYKGNVVAVLSGQEGADAHHYQEKHVREKIREAGNEKDNC